jgi:hypothetical protein
VGICQVEARVADSWNQMKDLLNLNLAPKSNLPQIESFSVF